MPAPVSFALSHGKGTHDSAVLCNRRVLPAGATATEFLRAVRCQPFLDGGGVTEGRAPATSPVMFDHERLDAYQAAIKFAAEANEIATSLPAGRSWLADQLRRAASSVCLNLAEGAGEFSAREKARFYRMAKRSATECAAILDIAKVWDVAGDQTWLASIDHARETLLRIVSMLVRLAKRLETDE